MTRPKPKEFDLFVVVAQLPGHERRVVGDYVYTRTCVRGCGRDDMPPEERMRFLTTVPGEQGAA